MSLTNTNTNGPQLLKTRFLTAFYWRKVNIERQPIPQSVRLLPLYPVLAVRRKLHVKVVHKPSQNDPHLRIGETVPVSSGSWWNSSAVVTTYFRPIQFLGPTLKACRASRTSPSAGLMNRSGLNSHGSLKLSLLWLIDQC
jgi:hypothetical protein